VEELALRKLGKEEMLSEETRTKIDELLAAGTLSRREIAHQVGCSRSTITEHAKRPNGKATNGAVAKPTNGHAGKAPTAPTSLHADIASSNSAMLARADNSESEVERVLREWWEALPLITRLTLALGRRGD